ncbi:hypothetical protein ACQ93L_22585, partial [Escherichia coli]
VCVVGKIRDLILQLSKSSIYSTKPLPFDESQQKKLEVPFTLLWHKRNSHNPKIVWLRETIKNLYASMA